MEDSPAIAFKKVSKSFGDERVLAQFDLSIKQNEFVSLVGPSGCGKSTVLRLISGLEEIDSGKLEIRQSKSAQDEIAFVFQDSNLLPWLTVFDNVALPFRITGKDVDREKVSQTLELVGLTSDTFAKYPKQLSGGMKMRVSIARSLILSPRILLLDEPFAALDDLLRTNLNLELVKIWQRDELTTLFVTHNLAEAIFVSQRIVVLDPAKKSFQSVSIPFDYPREKSIKTTREFAELFAHLSSLLEGGSE